MSAQRHVAGRLVLGRVVICTAFALTVVACSADDDSSAAGDRPSASSGISELLDVSPSPTVTPTFLETATCRTEMAPLVDTMLANDTDSLGYPTFHARYEELQRKMDQALLACSSDVARPATRVVYEYAVADLAWGFCGQERCAMDLIEKHVTKGTVLAYKVKAQVEETG